MIAFVGGLRYSNATAQFVMGVALVMMLFVAEIPPPTAGMKSSLPERVC